VTYSNELKEKILGVKRKTLETKGAVSEETVREMLAGLFKTADADYGVAVSGIAGPTGGSPQKPIGTIWYALGKKGEEPEIGTFASPAKTRELIILHTTNRLFGLLWRKIR
jgi:nicotinamide-nucleotide amidase